MLVDSGTAFVENSQKYLRVAQDFSADGLRMVCGCRAKQMK